VDSPLGKLATPLRAEYLKIQKTFVGGLAQRLNNIEQAPNSQASYDELHRLVGAAGGYGFDKICALAKSAMNAQSSQDTAQYAVLLKELGAAMHEAEQERTQSTE
jgi:hypothetical protein